MKECPTCGEKVKWYQRKWRLFRGDYVVFHWRCREKGRKTLSMADFNRYYARV